MSEFIVHAVDPNEGSFQSFVTAQQEAVTKAAMDFDPAGLSQTVYAAERVELGADGSRKAQVVGAMVCRWGFMNEPVVTQVIDPSLNGHTKNVVEGFEQTRASLRDLTGLNF